MSRIYFAWSIGGGSKNTWANWDWQAKPVNMLVSFFYLREYNTQTAMHGYQPTRLMLDSGAYSAWNANKVIDEAALIEESKSPRWQDRVALDVIGDPKKTLAAARRMSLAGVPHVQPVFHYGEDWAYLRTYCDEFDRVGLSCRFGEPTNKSIAWVEQCFAREWTRGRRRFHSFGWVSPLILMRVPFFSADTCTWNNAPAVWGRWRSRKGVRVKGAVRLDSEVDYYRALEKQLAHKWKDELDGL